MVRPLRGIIEARLTPSAKSILFSNKITSFKPAYDASTEEFVNLPVKFPFATGSGSRGYSGRAFEQDTAT